MTGRVVRRRGRVLLSDSSSCEDDDNIDVVVKHVVAEGNAGGASSVTPPGVDAMLLEDEIEDDDDDDISVEEGEPPVTIFPLVEPATPGARFARERSMSGVEGGGSPLHQLLRRRGVHVHAEWLESFVREMEGSHPGFSGFGVERQGELALAHLLVTDFNEVGAGCLPNSFEALHAAELPGPFVLQVTLPSPTTLRKMGDTSSDVFVHFGIEEEQCTCSDVCKNRARIPLTSHFRGKSMKKSLKPFYHLMSAKQALNPKP
jgi:hypothetical protein